jgi:hypothetical protein
MIFNGWKLLVSPRRAWPALHGKRPHTAVWLIAAAITAAVLPAAGVVVGHLGSAMLGYTDHTTATLRAAVGFISVAGGAMVTAPALTLLLLWLAQKSRGAASQGSAETVAMAIVWPVWTAGMVLAAPPLFGAGPEIGEVLWVVLAAFIAFRTIRSGDLAFLGIRRRWFGHFTTRAALAFIVLFAVIVLGPATTVRSMLGAAGEILPTSLPDRVPLPLPPTPNW